MRVASMFGRLFPILKDDVAPFLFGARSGFVRRFVERADVAVPYHRLITEDKKMRHWG